MIRTITDYYSHEFLEDEGIIAAIFITRTQTEYRVYFYPTKDYFENIPEGGLIYQRGYHFGFTKVAPNENKVEPPDMMVGNTIVNVVKEFFESYGEENILIFHCDDFDGKKHKRAKVFDEWFMANETGECFSKHNEEIVVNELTGEDGVTTQALEYLSLIIKCSNLDSEIVLEKFQQIKQALIAGK